MNGLAKQQKEITPQLEYGQVIAVDKDVTVATCYGEFTAQRAVSCLIRPEVGDQVLLSMDMQGGVWILSVLSRAADTITALEMQGDTSLRVMGGGLTIAADTEFNCVSSHTSMQAGHIEVLAESMSLTTHFFSSHASRVKRAAEYVDDVCKEFTRQVVNYFRITREHEDCQAESRRQLVEETLTVQSKNAQIVSEEQVKIDGELLHLG